MPLDSASIHPEPVFGGGNASILSSMSTPRRKAPIFPMGPKGVALKARKAAPHEFVLEAIAALSPRTNPMFGCLAVYVKEKIVLILRDKRGESADNGVWLATTEEHHESLRRDFPHMRSIRVLGKKITGWQVLPVDAPDFEEAAIRACELIVAGDPRIGKVPGARRASRSTVVKKAAKSAKSSKAAKAATTPNHAAKRRAR